jgi:hypothetical protein
MSMVRNWVFRALAVLAVLAASAQTGSAALVTQFNGSGQTTAATGSVFGFTDGNGLVTGQLGGNPPNLFGTSTSGLTFTLTSVTAPGGTYSLTPTFTLNGGNVTFTLNNPTGVFTSTANSLAADPQTFMTVTGGAGAADFGGIGRVWSLAVTLQQTVAVQLTSGVPGSATFIGANGQQLPPNLNFIANIQPPGFEPPTPEPATLVTFGIVGLVGGVFARRKMKAPVA